MFQHYRIYIPTNSVQDAVAHMIEGTHITKSQVVNTLTATEVPQASIEGPKIMMSCVGIGTFTGVVFLIVLLFVAGEMDAIINSSAGPLLQIFIHSTQNKAGAICLLMYVNVVLKPRY